MKPLGDDKTSYGQSLTHMIKGNLGAGLLGMGSSFAHLGLAGAIMSLPILCLMSGYCVHLLIRSARFVEQRCKKPTSSQGSQTSLPGAGAGLDRAEIDYPILARRALAKGPKWARRFSRPLGRLVDTALLVTQVGVCCVYIVFVVDNISSILASYHMHISKSLAFLCIFPVTLLLSFIRTLNRLAVASMLANLLQFFGLVLIVEFLARDLSHVDLSERDNFRPAAEMALGFGSTMFAFEGISVVLPIYSRMRRPKLMSSNCGVVNISFLVILCLYFVMGLLSYLKYGHHVRDSITLNLPAEPLYDLVRAMFTASILLSYPLQFYVPNEMVWKWAKKNLLAPPQPEATAKVAHLAAAPAKGSPFLVEIVVEPKGPGGGGGDQAQGAAGRQKAASLAAVNQLDAAGLLTKSKDPKAPAAGLFGNLSLAKSSVGGAAAISSVDEKQRLEVDELLRSIQESAKLTSGRRASELAAPPPPPPGVDATNYGELAASAQKLERLARGPGYNQLAKHDHDHDHHHQEDVHDGEDDDDDDDDDDSDDQHTEPGELEGWMSKYEYFCRFIVVLVTFTLAVSVPRLNLLMDLIGSFSGAALSLTIPATIHLAVCWDDARSFAKCTMIICDLLIIAISLGAGLGGSISSVVSIVHGH